MTLRLSTTSAETYRECPERYHFAKVQRRLPMVKPFSLYFGEVIHVGLDAWYRSAGKVAEVKASLSFVEDRYTYALTLAMLAGYHLRYIGTFPTVLGVEREYELPCESFVHTGRRDVDVDIDGSLYVVEHKTTTRAIYAGSMYWHKLTIDPQISNYLRSAEHDYGRPPAGVIYDVLHIPEEKPLKATPENERKLVSTGPRKGQLYAGQRTTDETPREYYDRLCEVISRDLDSYYARRTVVRLEAEAQRAALDLEHTARQIQQSHELGLWARNPAACGRYKEPCAYLPVCEGRASISDNKMYKDDERHA